MYKGANNTYWGNIKDAVGSLFEGLRLSLRHLWEARESRTPIGVEDTNYFEQSTGIVTLQYPRESFPVPDNGRYRLHNEIEDCIVCDKCAKICPVNCIEIEPVRAIDEDLGKTSDGTPKRIHAAKFDIDMGKCCFCGLCTTVCPTECLTMTKAYDFTEFDVADHIYSFAEMTPLEILEKKQKLEVYNQEKEKAQAAKKPVAKADESAALAKPKPSFKPRVKKSEDSLEEAKQSETTATANPKPGFKPKIKPVVKKEEEKAVEKAYESAKIPSSASPKPVFRPKIKPPTAKEDNPDLPKQDKITGVAEASSGAKPKPVFRPKVKPVIIKEVSSEDVPADKAKEDAASPAEKPKPVFKPKIKPVIKKEAEGTTDEEKKEDENTTAAPKKPRPVFRPRIKPKKDDDAAPNT